MSKIPLKNHQNISITKIFSHLVQHEPGKIEVSHISVINHRNSIRTIFIQN